MPAGEREAGRRRRKDAAGLTYRVPRCREECPVGRFGQDCAETCDCAPGARCFPANGACLCEHGFTGDRCTERLCPDGRYGLNCQASCTCHPEHSLRCVARTVARGRGKGKVWQWRPGIPKGGIGRRFWGRGGVWVLFFTCLSAGSLTAEPQLVEGSGRPACRSHLRPLGTSCLGPTAVTR